MAVAVARAVVDVVAKVALAMAVAEGEAEAIAFPDPLPSLAVHNPVHVGLTQVVQQIGWCASSQSCLYI